MDGSNSSVPLMWPVCLSHSMDESRCHPFSPPLPSPLHYLTPDTIATSKLEVIVTVTGSRQSGGAIYARTSYTMAEVVWGARFVHTVVLASEPSGGFTASCEQEDVDRSHPLPSSLTSSTHGG